MAREIKGDKIREIRKGLELALRRKWVFPACARYGELLAAAELDPETGIGCKELENEVRELIESEKENLASLVGDECRHVTQMIGSGYDLIYEELLAVLTSLSELAFVKTCLASLGIANTMFLGAISTSEIRECLTTQSAVRPAAWTFSHTIAPDCEGHWWWNGIP